MLTRRVFLGSAVMAGLAACQSTITQTAPAAAPAPAPAPAAGPLVPNLDKALTPQNAQDFRITQVNVTLAPGFRRTQKENGVSDAQILAEMRKVLVPALTGANAKGRVPVRAEVQIETFNFVGDASILLGNTSSSSRTRTTFYFAETGAQAARGAVTSAGTERPGGLIGATMVENPRGELGIVASNMPAQIMQRIFGGPV